MNKDEQEYVEEITNAYNEERTKNQQYEKAYGSSSMFGTGHEPNLIEFQLELDNILERVDHLLRGHELKYDEHGNLKWTEPEDKGQKLLNEYGVQEILRILSMYLNRNTILSNYDETTINEKVYDFGVEISDLFFMKYETMGLDTQEKIKNYPIICRILIDTIHSAYLRALHGGERESLRTARQVTQTEPLTARSASQSGLAPAVQSKRRFNVFNPSSWGKM